MAMKALVTRRGPPLSTEALSSILSTRTKAFQELKNQNGKSQSLRIRGTGIFIRVKIWVIIIIEASRSLKVIWNPDGSILKMMNIALSHQARKHFHLTILSLLILSKGSFKPPKRTITEALTRRILN
jgi:hypothetical protein